MPESKLITYQVCEVVPYISWSYFFHAWGFKTSDCRSPEALQLQADARRMLKKWANDIHIQCIYRLCRANSKGDDLLIEDTTFPLLRQQTVHQDGTPQLCLSDFIRPLSSGISDTIGLFASSVDSSQLTYPEDPYRHLLLQTLTDRLAEAATEKMHEYVRRKAWGYAPQETLPVSDLLAGRYQGIRPAVGYPSLPDQSVNFLLDSLLDMQCIGITLTENGAMHPHSSVSGLMLAHPAARYFSIGHINEDQLYDYARRRGLPIEIMRKFLAALL